MDGAHFDRLAKVFARLHSRRRLLALVAAAPLAGVLTDLDVEESAGKHQRTHHQRHAGNNKEHRNGKRKAQNDGCGSGPACGAGSICDGGTCHQCDICWILGGCGSPTALFPQSAIDAARAGATLYVCPGRYSAIKIRIDKNLTLVGAGPNATILDGLGTGRDSVDSAPVVGIAPKVEVTLRDLSITRSATSHDDNRDGGGIRNEGTLNLTRVIVSNNVGGQGAGIFNQALATVILNDGVQVFDNWAVLLFGGGGLLNLGTAILNAGSRITHNSADYAGGGILNVGVLTLKDGSDVSNNTASNGGGGILNVGRIIRSPNSAVSNNKPTNCVDFSPGTGCRA